jgi:hypothetical protein
MTDTRLSLSLTIREYDAEDNCYEYHQWELEDAGDIFWFCLYVIRHCDDPDMAYDAKRVADQYVYDCRDLMVNELEASRKRRGAKKVPEEKGE